MRLSRHDIAIVAIVSALSMLSSTSYADEKSQLRDQTNAQVAKLRAAGEPKDRCSIDARVLDGGIVVRSFGLKKLLPGDKLLSLNGIDISGKSSDEIVAVLRGVAPSAVVTVKANRGQQILDLEIACSNSRPYTEALLNGLEFASKGKFEECVTAFSQNDVLGAFGAGMKLQCASVLKNSKHNLAQLSYDAFRMLIEEAYWFVGSRDAAVKGLRQVEGQISTGLGSNRFQELVTATKLWPGGEGLYESSAPNLKLFRKNSEIALQSKLIDPDSARIEWTHGFLMGYWKPLFAKRIEGYWTCGLINARNRMGGFTGRTVFVVVLDESGSVKYAEIGTVDDFDLLTIQCNGSAKVLPPPSRELTESLTNIAQGPAISIADELKKLVDLRNSGALSEAEFLDAKKLLLKDSSKP